MNLLAYNLLGLKPKAFGLEIENCSIKAVRLEKKGNKFRLASCGKKIMPRGIVKAEQVVDPQKLAEEIKMLMGASQPKPIKEKNVIFSIPETKSFIRTIRIPKMSLVEAREAVKWETEANIPISVDKVYLDWQVIADKGEKEEILVVPVYRIFGSDELSSIGSSVKKKTQQPLVLMNQKDADLISVKDGDSVQLEILKINLILKVKIENTFQKGMAGLSVNLPAMPFADIPARGKFHKL